MHLKSIYLIVQFTPSINEKSNKMHKLTVIKVGLIMYIHVYSRLIFSELHIVCGLLVKIMCKFHLNSKLVKINKLLTPPPEVTPETPKKPP